MTDHEPREPIDIALLQFPDHAPGGEATASGDPVITKLKELAALRDQRASLLRSRAGGSRPSTISTEERNES